MVPRVFKSLCETLKGLEMLKDTRHVQVEEQLAMSLLVLTHRLTHRVISKRFQHSTRTVHNCAKRVVRALVRLGREIIKPVNRGPVQPEILGNPKWYPYFEKCLRAIDGTHVAAWAPTSRQTTFRGRKGGMVTQNVMAVCSHDMMFTFVFAGWEGSANDSRIFLDALSKPEIGFPLPPEGHYYVVDAGYPNVPGFLAPYRGEAYHLNEFRGQGQIRNKQALFNYRHSSLRNVIERCFGLLKARFPILKSINAYPLVRQSQIPIACCALHNFIRLKDMDDQLASMYGMQDMILDDDGGSTSGVGNDGGSTSGLGNDTVQLDMSQQHQMLQVREDIANAIWANYNN
ncbi:uncharacterized protein LOC116022779 [Ipomoea triloba]|uniref:uncharacterized protein LOC116022779 n=1 Tax=Ipomoea triloba TaxID=35885 RepID=UPI00125D6C3A|nr:uncharacterized protein LOC116022779 [Ipomoea triloba]